MEAEVLKGKKKRGRVTTHVIVNLNKPTDLTPLYEAARVVRESQEADMGVEPDLDKGKKRGRKKVKPMTPLHAEAEGVMAADSRKAAINSLHSPTLTPGLANDRVSEGLGRAHGNQSCSSGDHGVGEGRNAALAYRHQDLRQSNISFDQVLARLRTVRGNVVDLGVSDRTAGGFSHPGEVALRLFDAAGQAGSFPGMQRVNPSPLRPDYHQSRSSATAPNGSHTLDNPVSHVGMRTPLEMMRATQRRMDGQ